MAYCSFCGKKLETGETCMCRLQGDVFEKNIPLSSSSLTAQEIVEKQTKRKNTITILCSVTGLIILLVILLYPSVRYPYDKPLKTFVQAYNECDSKMLIDSIYTDYYSIRDVSSDDFLKLDEGLKQERYALEEQLGDNVTFSYEILEKERVDKKTLEDIQWNLGNKGIIQAKRLKVNFIWKGQKSEKSESCWLYIVRCEKSDWKIDMEDDVNFFE